LVGIARALVASPKIIFADEPTGNLHSDQADYIMQVFKELNQKDGVTVVQVTHSKTNAEYGNRVVNLKDGWLV
jgi:ABC-type lipoprotein export system ATPase subunit